MNNLYTENAAKRIMNKVEEFTSNLAFAPRLYAEIDKYKGTKRIYRRIVINNYVLLYTIDEEKKKGSEQLIYSELLRVILNLLLTF